MPLFDKTEKVILVDEQDHEIGEAEKLTAHQLGQLHRAFSIFIFLHSAEENRLLIQQRHLDKYHSGGLWTNTCCSHPRPGESIMVAAERRLQEEVGLKIPLKRVGAFMYKAAFDNQLIEHEYDHVFVGYTHNKEVPYNPTEISAVRWITLPELQLELEQYPHKFTPWLRRALEIVLSVHP
jgi:isopentenyl-diphosphate delta-isomerase type 1